MNMYKTMMKHQNTFFSNMYEALNHHKHFVVKENAAGLSVLHIDGRFVASCNAQDKNDMVLYYGNRETQRKINKSA